LTAQEEGCSYEIHIGSLRAIFRPLPLHFILPMQTKVFSALFSIASLFVCTSSHASLIGDTITLNNYWPDLGGLLDTHTVVVQAGPGDTTALGQFSPLYRINPEADSLMVSFLEFFTFSAATFNGFVASGINDTITGVTVSTNLVGWNDSRISFDAHSVSVNLQNLAVAPFNTANAPFVNVTLNTQSVPDGGLAAAMLGLGVIGLVAVRRRLS